MEWIKESIMAKRGIARGEERSRHALTIEQQGRFHYVYGPYVDPVLEVEPGAVIAVETHDAFEGKIKSESDKPSEVLNFPYLNPHSGPIAVTGADNGERLEIER